MINEFNKLTNEIIEICINKFKIKNIKKIYNKKINKELLNNVEDYDNYLLPIISIIDMLKRNFTYENSLSTALFSRTFYTENIDWFFQVCSTIEFFITKNETKILNELLPKVIELEKLIIQRSREN